MAHLEFAEQLYCHLQLLLPAVNVTGPSILSNSKQMMHLVNLSRLELETHELFHERDLSNGARRARVQRALTLLNALQTTMQRADTSKFLGMRSEDMVVVLPGAQSGILLHHYLSCLTVDAADSDTHNSDIEPDGVTGDNDGMRSGLSVLGMGLLAHHSDHVLKLISGEERMMQWRRRATNGGKTESAVLAMKALAAADSLSCARCGNCGMSCSLPPIFSGMLLANVRAALFRFEVASAQQGCNTMLYDNVCAVVQEGLGILAGEPWESPLFGAGIDHLVMLHRIRMLALQCKRDAYHSNVLLQINKWLNDQKGVCVPPVIAAVAFVGVQHSDDRMKLTRAGQPATTSIPFSVFESDDEETGAVLVNNA